MHPLDQFRAFKTLADKGEGEETVAAAFGVTAAVVKQRLRLAKASPVLLQALFPALPVAAGLSAAHLSAILFPSGLRRLYVLRDNDAAGDFAEDRLIERCHEAGIACHILKPLAKDLNADLRSRPFDSVRARMLAQFEAEDRNRLTS